MDYSGERSKNSGGYENAELGSNQQREKFLRLMGGGKQKEKFKNQLDETSHEESLQEITDKDHKEKKNEGEGDAKEKEELIDVKSANAWEKASLGDNHRKNKFLRLMGASKKTHTGKFVIGDSTRTDARIVEPKEKELEDKLETQYNQGLELRLSGAARRHTGLGFQEPEFPERTESKTDQGSTPEQNSDQQYHDREQRQQGREETSSRPRYLDHRRRDDRDYDRQRRDFRRDDRKPYDRPRDDRRPGDNDRDSDRRSHNRDGDRERLYSNTRDRSYHRDRSYDRIRDNRLDNDTGSQVCQRGPDPLGTSQPPPPPQTAGNYLMGQQPAQISAPLSQAPPPPILNNTNPQLPAQTTNQYISNVQYAQAANSSNPYQNQQWQQPQQQQPIPQFPNMQQPPPPPTLLPRSASTYTPQMNTINNTNQYSSNTPVVTTNPQVGYTTPGYYNQHQSYPYQVQPPPPPPPTTAAMIDLGGGAQTTPTNSGQSQSGSSVTAFRSQNPMVNFVKSSDDN